MQVKMKAIVADTSDYEYELLIDVINNVLFGPKPIVELMTRHIPREPADDELSMRHLLSCFSASLREMWLHQWHLFELTRSVVSNYRACCLPLVQYIVCASGHYKRTRRTRVFNRPCLCCVSGHPAVL